MSIGIGNFSTEKKNWASTFYKHYNRTKATILVRNEFGEVIRHDELVKDKKFQQSPASDNSSESIDTFKASFSSYKSYQRSTPRSTPKSSNLNKTMDIDTILSGIGLDQYTSLFADEGVYRI